MDVDVAVRIPAAPQEVWESFKDLSQWQDWGGVPMEEADWRSGGMLRYAPHDGIPGGTIELADYVEGQCVTLREYWTDTVYSVTPTEDGCIFRKRVIPKNGVNYTAEGYPKECARQQAFLDRFRAVTEQRSQAAAVPAPAPEPPKKKKKKPIALFLILGVLLALGIAAAVVLPPVLREQRLIRSYNEGAAYLEQGQYSEALEVFRALGDYDDAPKMALYAEKGVVYTAAKEDMDAGRYEKARDALAGLGGFKDSEQLIAECDRVLNYTEGKRRFESGDYAAAIPLLEAADGYQDAAKLIALEFE